MNLLIFVIAILFAMSTISYQALGRYKTHALTAHAFENYVQKDAICRYNEIVEDEYRLEVRSGGIKRNSEQKEDLRAGIESDSDGASTINFRFLVDPAFKTTNPIERELMLGLIKRLIQLLYGSQDFYQKLVLERPLLLDDLFAEVLRASEELPKNKQINTVKKLSALNLKDPVLQGFWYQLLRNNPVDSRVRAALTSREEHAKTPCYQVSLLDFLNNRNKLKLRVYLASKPLLFALLGDADAVNEVIAKRDELYKEVASTKVAKLPKTATDEFKEFCMQYQGVSQNDPILNFSVTKTNPKDYE